MTVNSGASAPTSAGAPERIQEGTMTTDQPRLAAEAGLLTLDDVATMTGLAPGSVRAYHTQANKARREGGVLPTDMPPPDVVVSRTPTWHPATIEAWMEARELRRREAAANGERWAQIPEERKAKE